MQISPPNSVHRMSMLGDLDKDCKTLAAESWHEWQRDLCLGFIRFTSKIAGHVDLDKLNMFSVYT